MYRTITAAKILDKPYRLMPLGCFYYAYATFVSMENIENDLNSLIVSSVINGDYIFWCDVIDCVWLNYGHPIMQAALV